MEVEATQVATPAVVRTGPVAVVGRRLLLFNTGVFLTLVLHDVDHLRQAGDADFDIPLDLFLANAAAYLPTALAIYLSWRRDRRARAVTIFSSVWWIALFVVVHLVGAGSFYGLWATPYPELGVDWISWLLFGVPVGVAAVAAVVAAMRPPLARR